MKSRTAKWLLLPLIFSWVASTKNVTFSQNYFGIFFSTYVLPPGHTEYWANDALDMVRQIATTFSLIQSPWIIVGHEKRGHAFVATNIAKFNKENPSRLLTLLMKFYLSPQRNKKNLNSFDLVMQRAEMANSIFPGTANILVGHAEEAHNLIPGLISARQKMNSNETRSKYKLGAELFLKNCEDSALFQEYVKPILALNLNLVIFEIFPESRGGNFLVQETVALLTERFLHCKEKVNNLSSTIEVAFLSAFPDTDRRGRQNFSNLVTFWEKMNDWAEMTKTKVFMREAFDQPSRSFPDNTRGWWRLMHNLTSPSEYVFQSKREAMMEQEKEASEIVFTGTRMPIGNIVAIVAISCMLLLGLVAGGMGFLYRMVIKRIEERQSQPISEDEIHEFFEGSGADSEVLGISDKWNVAGYDKKKYEFSAEQFIVDEGSPLGSGNFGDVFKAEVNMDGEELSVAVKTVRGRSRTKHAAMKGILSEIKVMGYLGHHENLVKMIGAYTSELRKGSIYLFLELCPLGSLEGYLRRLSSATELCCYTELLELDEKSDCEANARDPLSPEVLYRWAYEIASGMAFIASKHVVHADLATRNLLLSSCLSVKIADFGLSRRLYNYASYIKTGKEELPWRWMSPEALRRMEFNEKSDVWAYGITLWEIYSHGVIPYPGLCWSNDFCSKLLGGLRMEEPRYNANDMYSVMLSCWDVNPVRRPSFAELKENLKKA